MSNGFLPDIDFAFRGYHRQDMQGLYNVARGLRGLVPRMYVFRGLERTIAEMEKLKQG